MRAAPAGIVVSAARQATSLPGVRERWPSLVPTLAKAPTLRIVPLLASLDCPCTCSLCIDATVAHRPFPLEGLREALRFPLTKLRRRHVARHDPNFGRAAPPTVATRGTLRA